MIRGSDTGGAGVTAGFGRLTIRMVRPDEKCGGPFG